MVVLKELIEKYNLKIIGNPNLTLHSATDISSQKTNGITWIKSGKYIHLIEKGVVLLNDKINIKDINPNATLLITKDDPKLVFSTILKTFFTPNITFYLKDDTMAHRKNNSITIGSNVFIGQNVKIGHGTTIFPNVVIEANTIIGKNCVIKPHTSIGTEGLGLVLDKSVDKLVKFPQIGNVIIGDDVELGPNSTVRRGALKETVIKNGSKIGSLVNIGHNCIIGKNAILTCNIVTGGSSTIGDYSFIGVNSVIRNGVHIGKNTQIGMGTTVTKSIPDNVVAYGSPAKVIRANES